MRNETGSGRREPPRVYDRLSGEYRPVSRGPAGNRGSAVGWSGGASARAENRERRRRRSLRGFYFLLFLLVVSAAVAVSLTVLFKIDTISVAGTSLYTPEQIVAASGIKIGDNLFLARTGEAAKKIPQKLPYVGSVKVSRGFPAMITITVGQETVAGAISVNGKYAVVGSEGKVLELADTPPKDCALVKGLTVQSAKAGAPLALKDASLQDVFLETIHSLQTNGLSGITAMDFTSPSKILLNYQNRVQINLGLPSDLDYKIRYAKMLFDSGKISATDKGTLNLSVAAENDAAYFDPDYGSGS